MSNHDLVARAVERGAALLDSVKPMWWNHIDPGSLNIRVPELCVCGQVFGFGTFHMAMDELGLDANNDDATYWGLDIGLNPDRDGGIYTNSRLVPAWISAVNERRIANGLLPLNDVAEPISEHTAREEGWLPTLPQ